MTTFSMSSVISLVPYIISFTIFLVFVEQINYWIKKRHAAGPVFVLPFIGNSISLVRNPTAFWKAQSAESLRFGFSANYVLGRFILYIRDSNLSRLIFANVRPDAFMLVGHPFGKKLFGEHNLIYMFGQDHMDLRRQIALNFTPRALSTYTSLQQIIMLKHLKKWEKISSNNPDEPISLRLLVRDMNLETSQSIFLGPYLSQEEQERFKLDYNLFNFGSMKLPIDLPGFAFRKARIAIGRLVETLSVFSQKSKTRMKTNQQPSCLIDFWMQEMLKEISAAKAAKELVPPNTSDSEIGAHLFDFLFAAQDASTSSLLWAVALLESHPEILSKVREEVSSIWSPESDSLIGMEELREMKYTQAVVHEVLRYRPPATLVPHIAMKNFALTESYTIRKGTIVFPSVYDSSFQGFTKPDQFDPDRFSDERQEDKLFKKNFLTFGAGAHQCVGQRYAINYLVLFIAMFCTVLDFKRHKTDGCDDIAYNPTIIPKDGCTVFLSKRCTRYPYFSSKE